MAQFWFGGWGHFWEDGLDDNHGLSGFILLSPLAQSGEEPAVATANSITALGVHAEALSSPLALELSEVLFIDTDKRMVLSDGGAGVGGDGPFALGEHDATSLAAFGAMFEKIALLAGANFTIHFESPPPADLHGTGFPA
jgi:hypothetical protein